MDFIKKFFKKILSSLGFEIIIKAKNLNQEKYTTVASVGNIVACQIEAYFLVLNKFLNNDDKVLDVGFGLGYGINTLSIKASKIWGIEVDAKAYDYCQNTLVGRNPKLQKLLIYDGYHIDFPDEYFDIVTCVDVIEHVEDYEKLIIEMLRVCRMGVFISTPNRRPEYTNKDGTSKNYWHLREWNFEEFNKIIEKFGKIEWNFLNGPFDGPFTITNVIEKNTLTLTPFIYKKRKL